MKHIKIILGLILFASVTTFAQSPRIKLNQITKDTVKGSVLISSPSDSGMVYSRDFYIAYGADTVLILYGDTLAATSGIISSVLSDGVTITGNGTTGNELKVDTATVISTIKGLVDTLTNRGYLTTNETITLSGDVTGSGTTAITATVVDDSHNHIISNVDFLQDSLTAKANASELSNYVTIAGTETITGAKTFTANTVFDDSTLVVDATNNKVGIGTSSPQALLTLNGGEFRAYSNGSKFAFYEDDVATGDAYFKVTNATGGAGVFIPLFGLKGNNTSSTGYVNGLIFDTKYDTTNQGPVVEFMAQNNGGAITNRDLFVFSNQYSGLGGTALKVKANKDFIAYGNVGIGTSSPSEKLDVNGNARFRSIGSGASSGALHYTSTGVLTTNTSDVRLKTNLQPLENTLNKLLNINTYTFNWIDETDRVDLGMVAQEVEQIFPNIVFTNNVDGYKGIHYDKFSSILTKAIQEQQAIIETQQTEIDQLKTLITDLTNRLIILENK